MWKYPTIYQIKLFLARDTDMNTDLPWCRKGTNLPTYLLRTIPTWRSHRWEPTENLRFQQLSRP